MPKANSSLLASLSLLLLLTRDTSAQVTLYGLGAAEGEFLTQSGATLATSVGTNGVVTIAGKGATDQFAGHGTFDAVWVESSNGVVFSATGASYKEFMTCTVDRGASHALCSFSNSVAGQGTFTGTFEPTAIPVIATITPGATASTTQSTSTTSTTPQTTTSTTSSTVTSETTSSSTSTLTNPPLTTTTPLTPITPTDSSRSLFPAISLTRIIGYFVFLDD